MKTANHLSQEDIALFALQSLPEAEAAAALAHLRGCSACRKAVGDLQGDLALYSLFEEEHIPSAATRQRLLEKIAREKKPTPASTEWDAAQVFQNTARDTPSRTATVFELQPRSITGAPRRFLAWSGWAVAAALAVVAALQFKQREQLQTLLSADQAHMAAIEQSASTSQTAVSTLTDPGAVNVTLHQAQTRPGSSTQAAEAHAAYLPDRGALVFVANNLQPLEPYKVYELWLLPAEKGKAPIPAASFRPDALGSARVVLPTGPKFVAVAGFGVTVEESKTPAEKPTLPILLLGTSKT